MVSLLPRGKLAGRQTSLVSVVLERRNYTSISLKQIKLNSYADSYTDSYADIYADTY